MGRSVKEMISDAKDTLTKAIKKETPPQNSSRRENLDEEEETKSKEKKTKKKSKYEDLEQEISINNDRSNRSRVVDHQ
jgi:hypothetical protein